MKRNNLILGAVGVIATAAVFIVSPWESVDSEGTYTQKTLSSLELQSAEDAQLWMDAQYIDHSTGERIDDKLLRQIDAAMKAMPKSRALSFIEQGPDNIGGRTRAIQVDKLNNNVIWAGGVSGGLFKSMDQANSWELVDTYDALGSPFISSMCQFSDGTLFVATGSNNESWNGDGVRYTKDQGATWTVVPGTSGLSTVTEIVAPEGGTTLWLTSASGLRKWDFGATSLTSVPTGSGACVALQCSPNGQVFVAAIGSNKTYVSTDYGVTFTDHSGNGSTDVPQGGGRIEYAVSHGLNSSGNYSVYAVRTSGNLLGMFVSHDSGNSWSNFVGASGSPSTLDIYRGQGTYNSVVSVRPSNPERILVGGIDIWKWDQTASSPVAGGFEKLTQWALAQTSSKYAHADNHEMKWDGDRLYIGNDGGIGVTNDPEVSWYPANRGYNVTQFYGIAFDKNGGVMGGAQDNGTLRNDHQLSTWKEFLEVSGGDGFQCEISFFNPDVLFTTSQFNYVRRSGDGGQTAGLFIPDSSDFDPIVLNGNGSSDHPFHSRIFLAEYYDLNSEDSVLFIPEQNYAVGEDILIASASTGDSMIYTTPVALYYDDTVDYSPGLSVTETSVVNALTGQTVNLDLYPYVHFGTSGSGLFPPLVGDSLLVTYPTGIDTVVVQSLGTYTHYYSQHPVSGQVWDMGTDSVLYGISWNPTLVQDPYQSWYFMYINNNGGELWGTRAALRFAASDPQWGVVAQGIGGGSFNTIDVEFSKDLNNIYITTGSGTVRRLDGLGSLYTSDPDFETKAFYLTGAPTGTSMSSFAAGVTASGICVNPNDPDDILVLGGFGNNRRSANATSATPTFTSIGSIGSPSPASYDAIIDRNDPNIIVVGTSHGVFVTEDGGASWTDASAGFSGTPVYEVRQSWRTWAEGNFRPGEIYLGTFGRGIWSSSSYLGVEDDNPYTSIIGDEFKLNLLSFPNPTTSTSSVSFNLDATSNVTLRVYNLAGRLVKTLNKKNVAAGSNVIELGVEDLSNGTYIVKFNAGQHEATTKFMKM
ncbi:MAG: T9SS type A sorting domain-containing protein [Crocinitomicaceae bacterium]|nr:T9SS type A sorting domain-containing protein [Crocinitomicaceae bacterium]